MAIERLSGGLSPADGSDPRTFPAIFNGAADEIDAAAAGVIANGTAIAGLDGRVGVNEGDISALDGRVTAVEGDVTDLQAGFRYAGTRYFFSDGNFEKADPFGDGNPSELVVRAVRVRMVGGGAGGGAGQATGASESSAGSGGGGGGYAESFITDIAGLASTVAVERGLGGAGGTTGGGTNGGTSSFGLLVVATGGLSGSVGVPRTSPAFSGDFTGGGVGTVGDFLAGGSPGTGGIVVDPAAALGALSGSGGASLLGGGGRNRRDSAGGSAGENGLAFGGGGSGGANRNSVATDTAGGNGANGVVIVDVFV